MIKNNAKAGTLESNDCYITMIKGDKLNIEVDSIVMLQFGEQITKVVTDWAKENKVIGNIKIQDRGAIDCTILARLETCLERSNA